MDEPRANKVLFTKMNFASDPNVGNPRDRLGEKLFKGTVAIAVK
jgi:hypothetical protein